MTAIEILDKIEAGYADGKPLDFRVIRELVHTSYDQAVDNKEREALLETYWITMRFVEKTLPPESRVSFKEVCDQDYLLLLLKEVLIGVNVSTELMYTVTQREVKAGRMAEDSTIRLAAIHAMDLPYYSVKELLKIEQDRLDAETGPKGWRQLFGKK